MFWPLPPPTAKAGDHHQLPTHVISDGSGAHFATGRFDPETERFVPSGGGSGNDGGGGGNRTFNLDLGSFAFSAAGQADDGRLLLTGWVPAGHAAPVPSGSIMEAYFAASPALAVAMEASLHLLSSVGHVPLQMRSKRVPVAPPSW